MSVGFCGGLIDNFSMSVGCLWDSICTKRKDLQCLWGSVGLQYNNKEIFAMSVGFCGSLNNNFSMSVGCLWDSIY